MHNLHFIVVHGTSGADACSRAERLIADWGDENNWREFSGAISEHGKVYVSGEGRFAPEPNMTIQDCNKLIREGEESTFGSTALEKLKSGNTDVTDQSQWSKHDLWSLTKLAEHLYEIHGGVMENFDVLQHEFYAWQFDKEGVTHAYRQDQADKSECRWVVFVDMHS